MSAPFVIVLGLLAIVDAAWAQDIRTVTQTRLRPDLDRFALEVNFAAGRFTSGPGPENLLYRMRLTYDAEQFEPVAEFDARRRHAVLGARTIEVREIELDEETQRLAVELSPVVPTDLELAFGAGPAEVELGGLSLEPS